MERITKNFRKRNNDFIHKPEKIYEYFLFSQMIRKELLSDILEFELLLANSIISNFKMTSFTVKDLGKYHNILSQGEKPNDENVGGRPGISEIFDEEIRKNQVDDILEDLNGSLNMSSPNKEKVNIGIGNKIRLVFESMSFGKKIYFIKKLDRIKTKEAFNNFLVNWEINFIHMTKSEIDKLNPIDDYFIPVLEYIRDLRNTLAHKPVEFNENMFFNNAYLNIQRKYKIKWFNRVFKNLISDIHGGRSFYERLLEKVENNPKISNEIFYEIMSQPMWKSI